MDTVNNNNRRATRNFITQNRERNFNQLYNNAQKSQSKIFSIFLLKILILLIIMQYTKAEQQSLRLQQLQQQQQQRLEQKHEEQALATSPSTPSSSSAVTEALTSKLSADNIKNRTKSTTKTEKLRKVSMQRNQSNGSITILHELNNKNVEIESEKPLVLNTHEILPVKTVKKKPYILLDKEIIEEYEKEKEKRPLKKYELNPVIFDFNLGDLEDLEHHDTIKKGALNADSNTDEDEDDDVDAEGIRYNEHALEDDVNVFLNVNDNDNQYNSTALDETPDKTIIDSFNSTIIDVLTNTSLPTVVTVSPHIFKIIKNKNVKKGRELLNQKEDIIHKGTANSNSISHYIGIETTADGNYTTEALHSVNVYQIITNLYDHFYWQANDINKVVTIACGLEMQAYLTGLHANYEWAQKAYDTSARYRGQILYGNDKWLGQKTFCYELNRQLKPDERKHFQFEFFAAVIIMNLWLPEKLHVKLQLGECLPKSCTAIDVHAILKLDPYVQMLDGLQIVQQQQNKNELNTTNTIQIQSVRSVPGTFSYWHEIKFQIFLSFSIILLLVVIAASWYQAYLKHQQYITYPIPAISARIDSTYNGRIGDGDSGISSGIGMINGGNVLLGHHGVEKPHFELYQMKTLNEHHTNNNNNNIIVDMESCMQQQQEHLHLKDINGNKSNIRNYNEQQTPQKHQLQLQLQQQQHDDEFIISTDEDLATQQNTPTVATIAAANNTTTVTTAAKNGKRNSLEKSSIAFDSTISLTTTTTTTKMTTATANPLATTITKETQMSDYKLDTHSASGAPGTYEAKKQLGIPEQILLCFAFQTNANSILNIEGQQESQTSCVHGLRVISILWTIMVHTYLQMFTIGENRFKRIIVERSMWYQIIGNATFSVDTFFFISGFLVTLLYLKQEIKYSEDNNKFLRKSFFDTISLWCYRYIRLTPAYLFVIFFNDFSRRQTFDNSVLEPNVAANTCGQYWWRNILYINNFYPMNEICMLWSWYMANDMQFYIMATCLLVLSTRYLKTAVLTICAFLLSSWSISGMISLYYHYTHKVAAPFESFDFLYDKPWQRVGTYLVGMITGYIVYKVKTPPKISGRTNLLLWLCSFSLLSAIIFGVWYGELSEINTAFYVGIGHTAFSLGLVWMVLSCCWGYTPTINRILSYRCLYPLSRLTYCTYLIHPVLMVITSFRMTGTVHLNNAFILTIFLGNAVVSFVVAFFISVMLEAPIIRLLKIGFRK